MAGLAEWQNKNGKFTATQTAERTQNTVSSDNGQKRGLREWREEQLNATAGTDINSWITSANNLMSRYGGLASSWKANDDPAYQTFNDERSRLLSYAQNYRQMYQGNNDAINAINNVVKSLSDARTNDIQNYWSQWESKEDYDKAVQAQKDYEAMMSFDTQKGAKDIEALEKVLEKAERYKGLPSSNLNHDLVYAAAQQGVEDELKALGFSSYDEAKKKLSADKAYLSQATKLQERANIEKQATGAADFKTASTAGRQAQDNQVGQFREGDNWKNSSWWFESLRDANPYYYAAKHMTDDEYAVYNYYLGKGEKEKAEQYLSSLQGTIKEREAGQIAKGIKGNFLAEMMYAPEAGFDQFWSGIKGALNFSGEQTAPTITQYTSQLIREDLANNGPEVFGASVGQGAYDLVTTGVNMFPSILASYATTALTGNPVLGQNVGTTLMGISAGGNAYQQMVNQGYDPGKAHVYGALIGLSEAKLESLLGGISALGGKLSNQFISKALSKLDKGFFKFAARFGLEMASEGIEEGLQDILEPLIKNAIFDTDETVDWEQVAYSALLGALSAGSMNAVTGGMNALIQNFENGYYKGAYGDKIAQIVDEALEINPENRLAQKMKAQIGSKQDVSGRNIRRLVQDVQTAQYEGDQNKIRQAVTQQLQERGERANIGRIADIITKGVSGEQITMAERAELAASQYGQDIVRELNNSTGIMAYSQDRRWTGDLGTKAIRPDIYNRFSENTQTEQATPAAEQQTAAPISPDAWIEQQLRTQSGQQSVPNATPSTNVGTNVSTETAGATESVAMAGREMPMSTRANMPVARNVQDFAKKYGNFAPAVRSIYNLGIGRNQNVPAFSAAVDAEIQRGYNNPNMDYTPMNVVSDVLTSQQREQAYKVGQMMAKAEDIASGKTTRRNAERGGQLIARGLKAAEINKRFKSGSNQRTAVQVLRAIAHITGKTIMVYDSAGDYTMDEGWFDTDSDIIAIDINAGITTANDVEHLAMYAMLRTFGHEFTHFGEKWAPAEYSVLENTVLEALSARGYPLEARIRDLQTKYQQAEVDRNVRRGMSRAEAEKQAAQKPFSRSKAIDEIVANAMTDVLPESQFFERLLAKDEGVAVKLLNSLKQFISRIKAKIDQYFAGLVGNPNTEANALKTVINGQVRYLDGIAAQWDKMALAAVENYNNALAEEIANGEIDQNSEYVEEAVQHSLRVTEPELLNRLNAEMEKGEYDPVTNPDGGYITTYRSYQVIDGGLYPPMNAMDRDEDTGEKKRGYRSEYGVWEMSTESPEAARAYMEKHPEAKYAKFDLDGIDTKTGGVLYAPYLHSSNMVLNDQFTKAYKRNLVVVECRVPVSEMKNAYRAEYAKNGTGWHDWKPGPVAGKLAKLKPDYARNVFLSRYMMPVRMLSDAEVADMYKEYLSGTNLSVPWNVVTPGLRRALENVGVKIDYSDKKIGTNIVRFADTQENVQHALRDYNSMTYAEITKEQQQLTVRENEIAERKRAANNSTEYIDAVTEYMNLVDEAKELLAKRQRGESTSEENERIIALRDLRKSASQRIEDVSEKLGLTKLVEEEREIQNEREALRQAADAAWEREGAEKENAAIEKSGLSAPEYFRRKALRAFKTTTNFNETGYLLPDGRMLNFSGGERNHRYRDHREIGEIYEATSGTAALNRFLNDGNIRVMAESPGIDLAAGVEPTREQYAAIRKFINTIGAQEKQFYIDFSNVDGSRADNLSYDGNVNASDILNDIKRFYQSGGAQQRSALMQFHMQYSIRSINEEHPEATVGLNFNDPTGEHIQRVFDGQKIYETRAYHPDKRSEGKIQGAYLNKLTGIVQTGAGRAQLVGYWQLGDPQLRDFEWLNKHADELGNDGTAYQAKPGDQKWVYPITKAEKIDTPRPVYTNNMRARDITGTYDDGQNVQYAIRYPQYTQKDINDNSVALQSMSPVGHYTGNELGDRSIDLKQRVTDFFNSLGNNVYTDQFGDVALRSSSVHSEFRHGHTPLKVITYAAIPNVLKSGTVIDIKAKTENMTERIVVAAPVTVGDPAEKMYVAVMLQRDPQSQRLYAHDAVIEKELSNTTARHLSPTGLDGNGKLFITDILLNALNVKPQNENSSNKQASLRTQAYTDRQLLEMAANDVSIMGGLTQADRSALEIFKSRLDKLRGFEEQQAEQRRILQELQAAAKPDRDEITRTQNRINLLGRKISAAENLVLDVENKQTLKKVLQHARSLAVNQVRRNERARLQERSDVTKYRERVQAKAKRLSDMILKNSDKEHVPAALRGPLADFVASIGFDSRRKMSGGPDTKRDIKYTEALDRLRQIVQNQADYMANPENGSSLDYYLDLPEDFSLLIQEHLNQVTAAVKAFGAEDNNQVFAMDSNELKRLDQILTIINHSVSQINKLHTEGRFSQVSLAAQQTIQDMNRRKRFNATERGAALRGFLEWKNTLPVYAFRKYGAAGQAIFEILQNGWEKFAFNSRDVIDFANKTYTSKEAQEWSNQIHSIELEDGRTVQMTTAQIMSLYCLNKREQARGHILGGGVRVGNIEAKQGRKTQTVTQTENFNMTPDDVKAITDTLTDRQREVADTLQEYMNTVGTQWGNEVSMARFGYEGFGEKNYFPIESDQTNLPAKDPDAKANDLFRLLNMSMTKALTPKANNALVVSDIFKVFANHMSDMAKYNALALPVLDAMKWINYKESVKNDNGQIQTQTVQRAIEQAYGKEGMSYFMNFMKDLNGQGNGGRDEGLLNSLMSNYKVAAVAANLRVALLQPTSYFRASALLNPKVMTKAVTMSRKTAHEERMKYSGISVWKDLGFFDTNIGRDIEEQIMHTDTLRDKITDKALTLAEKGDSFTWDILWNACKLDQQMKGVKAEDLMKATAKRFMDVIYQTQVVDSTLTRTQLMRDKSALIKNITGFMSEPSVSYNLLLNAYEDFQTEAQQNGKAAAWNKTKGAIGAAFVAYVGSQLAAAIAESLMDAARDDDDYESYLDKWLQAFLGDESFIKGNLFGDMNPFAKIPLLKDIFSVASGYESTDMTMQWLKDLSNLGDALTAKNRPLYGKIYKGLQTLSRVTGIPLSNASREVATIWNNTIGTITGQKLRTYERAPKTVIKEGYEGGKLTEQKAIDELVRRVGMEEKDAKAQVTKWKYSEWDTNGGGLSQEEVAIGLESGNFTEKEKQQIWQDMGFKTDLTPKVQAKARVEMDENARVYNSTNWKDGMQDRNLSNADKDQLVTAYGGYYVKSYTSLRSAGYSPAEAIRLLTAIDTDNSGSVKQAEAYAYLQGKSDQQALPIWNSFGWATSWDKYKARQH